MSLRPIGILLLFLGMAAPAAVSGQEALEEARRLRDARRFGAAADSVRAYLRRHPQDAGAHWMLGQLLYWSGEHRGARRAYEDARGLGLSDPWLELDYASVLLALEEWDEAREILEGVAARGPPEARLRARALLGTLAYWRGDLGTATRRFEAVLDDDPDHEEAARQLREIREITSPWVGSRLALLDDNQPFRRAHLDVEGGVFVTPLLSVAAGGTPRLTEADTTRASAEAWLELRGTLPELRLDLSARGGGVWRAAPVGSEGTWTGRGELALRLRRRVELQARAERDRYLWTRASADTLLMVEALELGLDRSEAPGWAGRAAFRVERFPDDNRVRTAYAWILAPLGSGVRMGYAFSWADSEESRWTTEGAITPGAGTIEGRYDPYFTPEETRIHTFLAELSGSVGPGTARLSGEWGFAAREMAPKLTPSFPGSSTLGFAEREYTPWSLTASWTARLAGGVTLDLRGERRRTAFYHVSHLEVGIVYRFSQGR